MNREDTIDNLKIALKEYGDAPIKEFAEEINCAILNLSRLEQKHIIAVDKNALSDTIIKLNNIIECSAKNAGDDGGSYDRCVDEVKEAIEDILCFLDIDIKTEIVETKHLNYYSPYLIKLKGNK